MKYHYSYRRFTYPMMGERQLPLRRLGFRTRSFSDSSDKRASARPLVWRHQSGGEFGWEEGHIAASKSRNLHQ